MKRELYDYDIYPKVFLIGTEKTITLKPLGDHAAFKEQGAYILDVNEIERAQDSRFPGSGCTRRFTVEPDADGCLRLHVTFEREGMYSVDVFRPSDGKHVVTMRIYALARDMKGRYPFRGDLHMHTCRSDGHETPGVVAANYRGHGYDFTVISDHGRYFPSLEARELFRIGKDDQSDLTDFLIVPGEEVHLPLNAVHYVNFGGKFSINALVTPSSNEEKDGQNPAWRSFDGDCPAPMTREEYEEMIRERAKSVPREIESERLSFAAAQWIYEMQQKAGGLGIFPHPYWLCSTMQLSEDYTYFFYEQHPFDAFEVLGGERYYQHNGFQTSFYYEMKAKGIDYPVVGSTDSHGSTVLNAGSLICSTLVFAPENTVDGLVGAIKEKYSVAIDSISAEYRLVGDFRWVKFGSFLLEEWYPVHDLACEAEGYFLKQYVTGDENAEKVLLSIKGELPRMFRKYFEMDD